MSKAAIYHFTNRSEQRPRVYEKQLEILKSFALSKGFSSTDIYCDKSLLRSEREEFNRLLSNAEDYEAVIAKDFYHLSKNTMQAVKIMTEFRRKGVKTYTLENGYFSFEQVPTDMPLKVATYNFHSGIPNKIQQIAAVHKDILQLFITKKTCWTLVSQYEDICKTQTDAEQVSLKKMILDKEHFDIVLVNNLNDIHWRTANFCKIREMLKKDIHSLQDGYLKY